jgi:type IV secretory pathway component VirB8
MSKSNKSISAAQLERQQVNKSRHERNDRIWNIIMIVIAVAFIITILAIQASHHL